MAKGVWVKEAQTDTVLSELLDVEQIDLEIGSLEQS